MCTILHLSERIRFLQIFLAKCYEVNESRQKWCEKKRKVKLRLTLRYQNDRLNIFRVSRLGPFQTVGTNWQRKTGDSLSCWYPVFCSFSDFSQSLIVKKKKTWLSRRLGIRRATGFRDYNYTMYWMCVCVFFFCPGDVPFCRVVCTVLGSGGRSVFAAAFSYYGKHPPRAFHNLQIKLISACGYSHPRGRGGLPCEKVGDARRTA